MSNNQKKYRNRLINESSPYLQQHAHNPVDWYPWCKEAFDEAKKLDRPVFLSIGYSTCHWCHVMEQESFENEHIASIMNENFINIKVDREQYPNIDEVYMQTVQLMTGSGGWPLSVFLTPEGESFYGGTYFPPQDRYNIPGFERVLKSVSQAWKNKRNELLESASYITKTLKGLRPEKIEGKPSQEVIDSAYEYYKSHYDLINGGFGKEPKFPQPLALDFLLSYNYRIGDNYALEMVTNTLEKISTGGINDHVGGGFHRYSVDRNWLTPHFEKMLYDQALLSDVFLKTYKVTKEDEYLQVAKKTLDYVLRDMKDQQGCFFAAEDADTKGKEGIFYLWTADEIDKLFPKREAAVFKEYFGVTEEGNFENNTNVLSISKRKEFICTELGIKEDQFDKIISGGLEKLYEERSNRKRPHRDEKIIAAWNALMVSALSEASDLLQDYRYINQAVKSADFIMKKLFKNDSLARFLKDGKTVGEGFLCDYAFLSNALFDLYETTMDQLWLERSLKIADIMIDKFHSAGSNLFYSTPEGSRYLIVNDKPVYDHAIPSGNSYVAYILLKLYRVTSKEKYYDLAEGILVDSYSVTSNSPQASTAMFKAADYYLGPERELAIAVEKKEDAEKFRKFANSIYLPDTLFLYNTSENNLENIAPDHAKQRTVDDKVTVYVCRNFTCKKPVTEINDLEKLLKPLQRK